MYVSTSLWLEYFFYKEGFCIKLNFNPIFKMFADRRWLSVRCNRWMTSLDVQKSLRCGGLATRPGARPSTMYYEDWHTLTILPLGRGPDLVQCTTRIDTLQQSCLYSQILSYLDAKRWISGYIDVANIITPLVIDNWHLMPGLGTFENSRRTFEEANYRTQWDQCKY